MFHRITMAVALLTALLCASARGADALLELEVGGHTYVGKSLRHDQNTCWLLGQDGDLHRIPLDGVTSYRKLANTFRPISTSVLRRRLLDELGGDYEVSTRSDFLVAAPDGESQPYADLLDRVQRSFVRFFSRRSVQLTEPELPLAAIVFADVTEFADYCRRENVQYSSTLLGYYHPDTNRIVLYDPGDGLAAGHRPETTGVALLSRAQESPLVADRERGSYASIRGNLRDTLVHEATHQLAFNTGLHSRIGENPRWVVEGLALIFERQVPVTRGNSQPAEINEDYFLRFTTQVLPYWTPGSLKEFLASDRPFTTDPLNSYSLAWALTYYLSGRRSADYAAYLQAIFEQEVSGGYSSDQRLTDFQQAFGDDIDWLEVQLLRYIEELE